MAKFRENIEHPLQFQYEIMQRFMSEKDLKTFVDDYRNARKTKHTMSAPSPHQIRMASLVKEFGYVEAAKK